MEKIFERLVEANIQILPLTEITTHFVFERNGFACLVERRDGGFGNMGAPGVLAPQGLAMLVWRGENPYFVVKGAEQAASLEQVEELRRFTADLRRALYG